MDKYNLSYFNNYKKIEASYRQHWKAWGAKRRNPKGLAFWCCR